MRRYALAPRCSHCALHVALADDILDWVAAFTGDRKFLSSIDEFVEAHAKAFVDLQEGEYTLEYVPDLQACLAAAHLSQWGRHVAGKRNCTTSSWR